MINKLRGMFICRFVTGIVLVCGVFLVIQSAAECKEAESRFSTPDFKWEFVGIFDKDLKISVDMNNVEVNEDGVLRYWTKNESIYSDGEFYTLDYEEVNLKERTMHNIKRLIYSKNGEVKCIEFPVVEGRILETGPIPMEINYLLNNHPQLRTGRYK